MPSRNDNHDFAFVAGASAPVPAYIREDSGSEIGAVIDGVAVLLDWRKRSDFRCLADVRFVDQVHEYQVVAQPRELSYQVTNAVTGVVESYDPKTGILREGDSERLADASQLATEPIAARLAFPLSLGIWGRPGDSYQISGATRSENELVLSLRHQEDPSLIGVLVVDQGRRTAIRLDTPTLGIEYRDIQPDF